VEKALLFPNWSSFSRHMPSPYVSNSGGFSLNHVLGAGGAGSWLLERVSYFQQEKLDTKALLSSLL
jgi:hypothetical protein